MIEIIKIEDERGNSGLICASKCRIEIRMLGCRY